MKRIHTSSIFFILCMLLGVLSSCSMDDEYRENPVNGNEFVSLRFQVSDMLPTYIDPMDEIRETRVAQPKNTAEREIKTLHLFFFNNEADTDGKHKLATLKEEYGVVSSNYVRLGSAEEPIGANLYNVKISKDCFVEPEIKVVALANIQGKSPSMTAVFKTREDQTAADGESFVQTLVLVDKADLGAGAYGNFDTEDVVITCYEDLVKWIYAPKERDDVRELPEGGMPMMGEEEFNEYSSLETITLKALMARIEINITLEPNQTSRDGNLPILKVNSYGIENMAATVPFVQPTGEDIMNRTMLRYGNIRARKPIYDEHEINAVTAKRGDRISLTYYTYENIQGKYDKKGGYPNGVYTDADMQRWKPTIANETTIDEENDVMLSERATRIFIEGEYTTHQGFKYNAKFNIYLGGNTTTDFSVKRNHCYTNNVTIHGLDYVRNDDEGVYTFDGRVNVKDENNPWYISVVNERKIDAHASVLPMDIYLVLREDQTIEHPEWTNVEVKVIDEATNDICKWIGFEMIDYPTGMIPYRTESNYSNNAFVAGTGAQKYFYWNLVTASDESDGATSMTDNITDSENPRTYRKNKFGIQKEGSYRIQENEDGTSSYLVNGSEVFNTKDAPADYEYGNHIEGAYSRMRIYFYIDENVPETDILGDGNIPARHARVELTYKNSNGVSRERKIEIDQASLLYVNGTNNGDVTRMYIETYEEYLEHSDPLEFHVSAEMFEGLSWGPTGQYITSSNTNYNSNANNTMWFHRGRYLTNYAITNWAELNMGDVYLYNEPNGISADKLYALNYCYGKNKRQSGLNSGETEGAVWTGGNGQWELPGIRDLEVALESYYSTFPEFQNYFYWSAAPAQQYSFLQYRENTNNARACKVYYNPSANDYTHANSNYQATYPTWNDSGVTKEGGNAPRGTNSIRIRAAYKTNQQNNQY